MDNYGFECSNCHKFVQFKSQGTHNRNHCPYCLCSLHVDEVIGDRSNTCLGIMFPIGKIYKPDGEEMIIHQCKKCGFKRKNRVAGDDDWDLVDKLPVLDPAVLFNR